MDKENFRYCGSAIKIGAGIMHCCFPSGHRGVHCSWPHESQVFGEIQVWRANLSGVYSMGWFSNTPWTSPTKRLYGNPVLMQYKDMSFCE
jgi:hypothetical protein